MANKYAVATGNWSAAATWSATSGGAGGDGKPATNDNVFFDAASGAITVTCDETPATMTNLTCTGFTGTWDLNDKALAVIGNLVWGGAAATISNSAIVLMAGTGKTVQAVAWQNVIAHLYVSGTVTLANTTWISKLTVTGSLSHATNYLVIDAAAAGWWNQTGTIACNVRVTTAGDHAPGDDIAIANKYLWILTNGTNSVVWDGHINLGSGHLMVAGTGAADSMTVDFAGYSITCGSLAVGYTSSTANGIIDLGGGEISVAGNIARGHADNSGNAINHGSSRLTLAGTYTGTGITVTADDDSTAEIYSGTITAVTSAQVINAYGSTDGTGNTNITFSVAGRELDTPGQSWAINAVIAAGAGCEELLAAPTAGAHYLESVTLACDAAITVTLGAGETAGAVTTILMGPIPFAATNGSPVEVELVEPVKLTDTSSFTLDASGAGDIWVQAGGFTR